MRQQTSQSLSCDPVVEPPENDNGVYRISLKCQSERVMVSCTVADAAVLFATQWGGYSRKEVGSYLHGLVGSGVGI